jgi:hypothetical protein
MSYLKFSPGSASVHNMSVSRYIAWPVKAIPIQFWDATAESFDILEESELRLIASGIQDEKRIQELLGIPSVMSEMVRKTTRRLINDGFISNDNEITEKGSHALHDQQLWHKRLQHGMVFFDKVRGLVFPFVHIGPLEYYSREQISGMKPAPVDCKDAFPDNRQLKNQTLAAIVSYNQRRAILERDESSDQYGPDDLDQEFDQPLQAFTDQQIEDFSLDLPEYGEDHFIVVQLCAEYVPGINSENVVFHSYSPFSHWEQNQYLNVILDRANTSTELRNALDQLKDAATEKHRNLFGSAIDEGDLITNGINKKLDESQCKLPEDFYEEVYLIEHRMLSSIIAKNKGIKDRAVVESYGVCIENSLRAIAAVIDPLPIAFKPKSGKLKITWYDERANMQANPHNWLSSNLPSELRRKINQQLENLPDTYGRMRTMGGRDILVKLMLFVVSRSDLKSSREIENLIAAIEHQPDFLHHMYMNGFR